MLFLWLSSVPLYICTTFFLIHSVDAFYYIEEVDSSCCLFLHPFTLLLYDSID